MTAAPRSSHRPSGQCLRSHQVWSTYATAHIVRVATPVRRSSHIFRTPLCTTWTSSFVRGPQMGALWRDRTFRKGAAVCAAAAMVLAGSACSARAGGDTGGGDGADTATAKATVVKYSKPMTAVDLPPVSRTPEPGKKIIFVV